VVTDGADSVECVLGLDDVANRHRAGSCTQLNFKHHMVLTNRRYGKLANQIPAGETVLGSPSTGAQFSSIWSGHAVVIPHVSTNPPQDML